MGYKVLIPQDISPAGKTFLREKGYEVVIGSGWEEAAIIKEIGDCDAVLARTAKYTRAVMEAGKKLKVIARYGAGVDNIDLAAATELGIQVTNAPQANSNSVAEHTITMLLCCAKNMLYQDGQTRRGNWDSRNNCKGIEVEGKVLGLVGLGRIGRSVAKKASEGLEMKVIGFDAYMPKELVPPEIEIMDSIREVFQRADFVSLHMPCTAETKGSINQSLLREMKKSAYLINCARGELVNEQDLYQALKENWIAGAALDVLVQEPATADNPIFSLENTIVSPHNAALTYEAMDRMGVHAAIGIDEVLTGKKVSWPVNHLKAEK